MQSEVIRAITSEDSLRCTWVISAKNMISSDPALPPGPVAAVARPEARHSAAALLSLRQGVCNREGGGRGCGRNDRHSKPMAGRAVVEGKDVLVHVRQVLRTAVPDSAPQSEVIRTKTLKGHSMFAAWTTAAPLGHTLRDLGGPGDVAEARQQRGGEGSAAPKR